MMIKIYVSERMEYKNTARYKIVNKRVNLEKRAISKTRKLTHEKSLF